MIYQSSFSRIRIFVLLVVFISALSLSLTATAQEQIQEGLDEILKEKDANRQETNPWLDQLQAVSLPPGTIDCFDHYTFGSVEVDVEPSLEQTIPGGELAFDGTIRNNNPYPVVNGQVYVKVFKKDAPWWKSGG